MHTEMCITCKSPRGPLKIHTQIRITRGVPLGTHAVEAPSDVPIAFELPGMCVGGAGKGSKE